jgi:hypothetical protein
MLHTAGTQNGMFHYDSVSFTTGVIIFKMADLWIFASRSLVVYKLVSDYTAVRT